MVVNIPNKLQLNLICKKIKNNQKQTQKLKIEN